MPTVLLGCVVSPVHPTTDTSARGAPVSSPALGSAPARCANEQGNSAAPGPAGKFKTNSSAVKLSGKCAGNKGGPHVAASAGGRERHSASAGYEARQAS